MNEQAIARVNKMLDAASMPNMVFSVLDEKGYPSGSLVGVTLKNGMKELYFGSNFESNKAKRVRANGKTSLCWGSDMFSITLVGTTTFVDDLEIKKKNWRDEWAAMGWTGYDDPDYTIFKFTTERYSICLMDDETQVYGELS